MYLVWSKNVASFDNSSSKKFFCIGKKWPLIGLKLSRDLNTELWLVATIAGPLQPLHPRGCPGAGAPVSPGPQGALSSGARPGNASDWLTMINTRFWLVK